MEKNSFGLGYIVKMKNSNSIMNLKTKFSDFCSNPQVIYSVSVYRRPLSVN